MLKNWKKLKNWKNVEKLKKIRKNQKKSEKIRKNPKIINYTCIYVIIYDMLPIFDQSRKKEERKR